MLISQTSEELMFVVDSEPSMHMLSKSDLSSEELDTLRRSRTPMTVVTANGDVQTNEEAQVCVHDLDLCVTVQFLDNTTAVLSLGKLYEEHGYSYEWITGPQLTKNGNKFHCKTDNYVPLVVPGLVNIFRQQFVHYIKTTESVNSFRRIGISIIRSSDTST